MKLAILLTIVFISQHLLMKAYIKYINRIGAGQPVLENGPDHQAKNGTPTMGGIVFIFTIVIYSIVVGVYNGFADAGQIVMILAILAAYALIGIRDDYLKIVNNNNASGLTPKQKLLLQMGLSLSVIVFLVSQDAKTTLDFFFFKWDLGYFYYLLIPVMFMGMTNATNITDGLDGLLTSNFIVSMLAIGAIAFIQDNKDLYMMAFVICLSLLSFLIFNRYPAKVFMGDTGSLALGGLLCMFAIALKVEIFLVLFGFVYIIETLSVIAQVSYFKYTKKKYGEGRRILKMAPLHHHFEKTGYSENQIVTLFVCIQIVMCALGVSVYYFCGG